MKALTLTQPWASLIALGHKQVETRSWRTSYRGPLAIHAAQGFPRYAKEFAVEERALGRVPDRLPLGAIVCVVDLVGMERTEEADVSGLERHLGDFSPGRWAWRLANLRAVGLFPVRGALGLWECPAGVDGVLRG